MKSRVVLLIVGIVILLVSTMSLPQAHALSRGPNGFESRLSEYIPGLIILITGIAGSLLFFYRVLNGLGLILQKDERKKEDQQRE